ncbi:uncharacterized protein [Branchiostoma lanceolatum]|uniref:uncharacterized protein isoform X1 n=1 Tax=Branchiostoma lanceolatum TaxID=7740 RepID=UPI0034522466
MRVLGVIVLGCVALLSSSSSALGSNRKQAEVVDKLENRLLQILLAAGDKEEQQDLSEWGNREAGGDNKEQQDLSDHEMVKRGCRWIGTGPFCYPRDCYSWEYQAESSPCSAAGIKKKCCAGADPAHSFVPVKGK